MLQPAHNCVSLPAAQGPYYVNPLMSFIDNKCLIFTPEEENKLEYTTVRRVLFVCHVLVSAATAHPRAARPAPSQLQYVHAGNTVHWR